VLVRTLTHRACTATAPACSGGALVWIAPSGGRDRPNAEGVWTPDTFDPTAVELMASLIGRAKKPGHLYPMAMFSYPVMPPPSKVWVCGVCAAAKEERAGACFETRLLTPLHHPLLSCCASAAAQVEANIGERRLTAHSGVGISLCPELDVAAITDKVGVAGVVGQAAGGWPV
jgi:glycerol-3-phosphate O-acyltransferase